MNTFSKHYTIDQKCAYVMSRFFSGEVGSRHRPSLRYIGKSFANPERIINHLVADGYLSVLDRGGFLKGTTLYQVEKQYPEFDISELIVEVETKLKKRTSAICNASGIQVDIGSDTDKEQIKLAQAINSDSVIVKQSPNGTVWTVFCNLKREHRSNLTYGSERIVEIDINASIPRLLITFFKNRTKDWLPEFAGPINSDLESYEKAILSESDAYIGIRNALGLDMSRDELKKALLPVMFGAGTKDEIKQKLTEAMMETWPAMYSQLKRYSDRYRFRTKEAKSSWKNTQFANMIFSIQAQIINKALSQISGPKLSVYDCICVPESSASLALTTLFESWTKITGDSDMFSVKIDGLRTCGSDLRSAQALSLKDPHAEDKVGITFSKKATYRVIPKSDTKKLKIKTWTKGDHDYWRAIVDGARYVKRKDSMTEDQFRQYIEEKVKAKPEAEPTELAKELDKDCQATTPSEDMPKQSFWKSKLSLPCDTETLFSTIPEAKKPVPTRYSDLLDLRRSKYEKKEDLDFKTEYDMILENYKKRNV